MVGELSAGNHSSDDILSIIHDITGMCSANTPSAADAMFRKDCIDLVRRISLLTYLFEEVKELNKIVEFASTSSTTTDDYDSWSSDMVLALHSAKRLLSIARNFRFNCSFVDLVRTQLRRATDKHGFMISKMPSHELPQSLAQEISQVHGKSWDSEISLLERSRSIPASTDVSSSNVNVPESQENSESKCLSGVKKPEAIVIPEDFLCPISLELMRDPVIVATGQTYERSYIQRWIDCGNITCPKTQQKLQHLTLTPNYVLRSLITQWCIDHNIEQPTGLTNGKIKKSDGSFRDVTGDVEAIEALVRKLSSRSIEERRSAVSEIRSLSKRSTDKRILIAEAGAIPVLVSLLTSEDVLTQDNAITSILNLSICGNNKGLIMLAGAIPSIVQVLRAGTMESRENTAATLFSLSLADENKIIIGASGAIPALVELLQNGSPRGGKDAATALFNLCIYQGNKGKAIRAGIITSLLKMLTDSSKSMVDEALTIMSVLASHHEAKVAIVKASTIPVLIDILRTGLPRNKENAAAILFALCKRDTRCCRTAF
ncbi:hypothetical protein TanjilG_13118 [Lupinus angustifolius]|uniref:RING-type E3 ubiquitin transferase n=1 Tax=Lupinus angustifolius TaxID=3871 RepID=A0A1J7FYR4_LUPAN|nr:hypothetical protein TanjilG_13118 [Lupinus angustifolius]